MKGWHNESYRHSLAARKVRTSLARIPAGTLRPSSFFSSIKEGAIKGSRWGDAPSKTSVLLRQEQLQGEKYPNIVQRSVLSPDEEREMALNKSLLSMKASHQRLAYFGELAESVKPRIGERYVEFIANVDELANRFYGEEIVAYDESKNGLTASEFIKSKIMDNIKMVDPNDPNIGEWVYAGPGYGWVSPEVYAENSESMGWPK